MLIVCSFVERSYYPTLFSNLAMASSSTASEDTPPLLRLPCCSLLGDLSWSDVVPCLGDLELPDMGDLDSSLALRDGLGDSLSFFGILFELADAFHWLCFMPRNNFWLDQIILLDLLRYWPPIFYDPSPPLPCSPLQQVDQCIGSH